MSTHLEDDETFVSGRSKARAVELLAKAEAAGEHASVVRTTDSGYIVPTSILEESTEFDPGKHKVDEVLDYLGRTDGHDPVTVEEFDRVLAAERAGKARKSLLEALEETPEQPEADAEGEPTDKGE